MASPKIILTTQFTVNQPFGSFLEYMNREEAKQSETLLMEKKDTEPIQHEEMEHYLHYMNREKALIDKQKMSPKDFKELELIAQHNDAFREQLKQMKMESPVKESFQTGLFDLKDNDLSKQKLSYYEQKFNEAQQKGNVLFQDVVSFETKGLVEAGVYNPYNNHLKREPLIDATRKMMKTCYKSEGLDKDTISIGAIHYNTEHFHIHVATIEPNQSTRNQNDDGEQRGKRSHQTIQSMKRTFANQLFKRDEQLTMISQLRDDLRTEIKPLMKTKEIAKSLETIKKELPKDKSKWNTKSLTPDTKQKMYHLIDQVMENNPNFKEYKRLAKEEDKFKREVYGELPKGYQSFYEGRLYGQDGIYYRLSNSVLEELKKQSTETVQNNPTSLKQQMKPSLIQLNHTKRCINKMDFELKQMNRHLSKTVSREKQKAQYEYEKEQRSIDFEL